ncbi:MAG: sulfatase [Planctomycetes bacterium]|nr:sulfatase [Planctomycetota bacterium]
MTKYIMIFLGIIAVVFADQKRPNIVWLTTEDNSANWYRLYNPEHGAPMPNIEKLAKNGIVFNHAYSNAPVCSAARSTIISGCYGPRTGAQYHRKQQVVQMPGDLKPYPAYLKEAGYYTSNNYKTDYNYEVNMKEAWNESSKKASYRKRKPGQPFFHVQNYTQTHESKLFGNIKGRVNIIDPDKVDLFPYHPDTPTFRQKYAQYLTMMTEVDKLIGQFVNQLEKEGLLDDTFIFHYGDHGGVLPGGKGYAHNDGLQVAMVVYVPKNWQHLVPSQRGSRMNGFVEFVDLGPTVLKLAGIETPEEMDGKAFLGEGVSKESVNERDTAFGYADRFDEKYDMVRFLRKGKFSYWRSYQPFNFDGLHNFYRYKQPAFIEWRDLANSGKLNSSQGQFYDARPPEMLFDLSKDPHEVNNLANHPEYEQLLKEMRLSMQSKVKSLPDVGFYPESEFLNKSGGNGYEFGQNHKKQIAKLIDIADLQLMPFSQARADIKKALDSEVAVERYWALITCSTFGSQAQEYYKQAKDLAHKDSDRLVRVRAAEFLGLCKVIDPMPIIYKALDECSDDVEANLILNSVVMLRDGAGVKVDPAEFKSAKWSRFKGLVPHRVAYLGGGSGSVK